MIDAVAQRLQQARSVLFVTGAGLSADSGLPTYRGIGGLYDSAQTEDGIPIEVALSGATFERRPELTWKYIHQIEASCRHAGPNEGHKVIARMQSHFEHVCTLTQNVDGFHNAAGGNNIIDIHGDVHRLLCTRCGTRTTVENYAKLDIPPNCKKCQGLIRPEVVLFGEALPFDATRRLSDELSRGFDAVFSVGTTSVFPYIAQPVIDAARRGALTVEINPGQSEVSHLVDFRIQAGAADTLVAIEQALLAKP